MTTLADTQAGDQVVWYGRDGLKDVVKRVIVHRVTATQIILRLDAARDDETRFSRKTGREVGTDNWHGSFITSVAANEQ